jgi:sodium-independent sulfate anion transporter 11
MVKKKEARRIFVSLWKLLIHRIYILSWIFDYDREKAIADLIAGITLGLTLVPQGIAYASLANLPSQV